MRELGGLVRVGLLAVASAADAEALADNNIEMQQLPGGCRHELVLKPFGEQTDPDESFPVFSGALPSGGMQLLERC